MGGKSKGEDRNEKMIRYLLKLPENRRCINCNSLGPQYVCTTFWTFICTSCSGVHREFTHRVKSVSIAKFSDEEVYALQTGGNELARQTYLKTWDPGRNSLPHNTNINKLRDFIKHVYEERRYTGDINRFSKSTLNEKEDPYKQKYSERHGFSKRHDDTRIRLSGEEKSVSLRESPRQGRSPTKESSFEAFDGRHPKRDPRFLRRSATEMFTTKDLPQDKHSSIYSNSRGVSTPPVLNSIQELLGGNVPKIRIEKLPKGNRVKSPRTPDKVYHSPQPWSSKSHDKSIDMQHKKEASTKNESSNSEPLVDFTTQSEPPLESNEKKVVHKNALEYLLFELASPDTPSRNNDNSPQATSSNNELVLYDQDMASTTTPKSAPSNPLENEFTPSTNLALISTRSAPILPDVPLSPNWMMQNTIDGDYQPMSAESITRPSQMATSEGMEASLFDLMSPTYVSGSISTPTPSKEVTQYEQNFMGNCGSSQPCDNLALVPLSSTGSLAKNRPETVNQNNPECHNYETKQSTNFGHGGEAQQGANYSLSTQLTSTQPNPTQRKEIPYDLFSSLATPGPVEPSPWWQNGPYNMGYNMQYQYRSFMQGPTSVNPPRSTNPFDINTELNQGPPNSLPSMASMQRELSNMSSPQCISPTSVGHQMLGTYMGQNFYTNTPPYRPQREGNFVDNGAATLGSIDINQQPTYSHSASKNQSYSQSRRGNPFA